MESIIKLPVRIHLITDPKMKFTTSRSEDEIENIFNKVNQIWSSAQIQFEIFTIQSETLEYEKVIELLDRTYKENPSNYSNYIDIYFLNSLNMFPGINLGYTRRELRRVFIVDKIRGGFTDYRCVAHELGHVLRLDHVSYPDRLMYQQGNEEKLNRWEIEIARHMATMRN